MRNEYIIGSLTEEEIDKVIKELYTPGIIPEETFLNSLSRNVDIVNYLPSSQNEIVVSITESEAQALSSCSYIKYVEPVSKEEAVLHSQRGKTRTLSFSGQQFTSEPIGLPESWAFGRCNSLSALPPYDRQFTYHYTGSGVDAVIIDSGILLGHPEWNDQFGNSRVELINWSLFAPITASPSITVTQPGGSSGRIKINGVDNDTIYVVKDRVGAPTLTNPAGGFPATYRTGVYNFNLNGLNTTFNIGSAVGVPFDNRYVSNNSNSTGTVTLTVWPVNNLLASSGQQNVMYYWAGNDITNSGVITRTDYNCQSDNSFYYNDTNGHGSHCTGTVAGSSCGWAIDSKIFSGRLNFSTSNGYSNGDLGIMLLYDLITRYHNYKKTVPSLSSRPTVTSNSYGWGYGAILNQVNNKVKQMTDAGVHFVHSAGNDYGCIVMPSDPRFFTTLPGESSPCYPIDQWSYHNNNPVICVGAIGNFNVNNLSAACAVRAEYSNYGNGVSIYAPGSDIQSVGVLNGNPYPGYPGFLLYKESGTSMACPNVAGVLCTILERFPSFTPQEAKNFIMQCATVGTLSSNPGYGYRLDDTGGRGGDLEGTNITLSKFPPTYIATELSNLPFAKHLTHCYSRTGSALVTQSQMYYLNSVYKNSTSYYLNSSTDLRFLNNCTPG